MQSRTEHNERFPDGWQTARTIAGWFDGSMRDAALRQIDEADNAIAICTGPAWAPGIRSRLRGDPGQNSDSIDR